MKKRKSRARRREPIDYEAELAPYSLDWELLTAEALAEALEAKGLWGKGLVKPPVPEGPKPDGQAPAPR